MAKMVRMIDSESTRPSGAFERRAAHEGQITAHPDQQHEYGVAKSNGRPGTHGQSL